MAARFASILGLTLAVVCCATTSEQRAVPSAAASAPASAPATAGAAAFVFPGAHWDRVSAPEAVGFSRAKLESALDYARELQTTGLIIVAGGRILAEYGNTSELSYLASVRKSVLAMLYGPAVESGKIRLEATLAEIGIDDVGGLSAAEKEATVADLLAARSGIFHPASNPGDNLADAPARGSKRHGEYFLYSNWDFNALGTIFEKETGKNIYDALEAQLAVPLAMEDFRRDAQKKSGDLSLSVHPAYHFWLSTRDMARIGYLMLREGRWADQQLVPASWVRRITRPITALENMNPSRLRKARFGYGNLWWVFDDSAARKGGPFAGAYSGMGAFGQFITVLPRLDLVVAHKTAASKEGDRSVSTAQYLELLDRIVAAHEAVR